MSVSRDEWERFVGVVRQTFAANDLIEPGELLQAAYEELTIRAPFDLDFKDWFPMTIAEADGRSSDPHVRAMAYVDAFRTAAARRSQSPQ